MSYTITTPPSTLLPPTSAAMISFLENFYRISDTESLHNEYVTNFTEDATLIMGSKVAKGLDGMLSPIPISSCNQLHLLSMNPNHNSDLH